MWVKNCLLYIWCVSLNFCCDSKLLQFIINLRLLNTKQSHNSPIDITTLPLHFLMKEVLTLDKLSLYSKEKNVLVSLALHCLGVNCQFTEVSCMLKKTHYTSKQRDLVWIPTTVYQSSKKVQMLILWGNQYCLIGYTMPLILQNMIAKK